MRQDESISRKTDIGYVKDAFRYEALLDGRRINDVITADEEKGMVLVYKRDKFGDYIMTESGLEREILKGKIKIVRRQKDAS